MNQRILGLIISYFSVLVIFFSAGAFGYKTIYSYHMTKYRDHVITLIGETHPWLEEIARVSSPTWLPSLGTKITLSDFDKIIASIYDIQEKQIAALKDAVENEIDPGKAFKTYISIWLQRAIFCERYLFDSGQHYSDECVPYSSYSLPEFWRNLLIDELFGDFYFYPNNEVVVFGHTTKADFLLCNLSPFSVTSQMANWIASPQLSGFYRDVVGISDFGEIHLTNTGMLPAGDCFVKKEIIYDEEPLMSFSSVPQSPKIVRWANSQLNLRYETSTDNSALDSNSAYSLCVDRRVTEQWKNLDDGKCYEDEVTASFNAASKRFLGSQSYLGIITHPNLPLFNWVSHAEGFNVSDYELGQAKRKAKFWSDTIDSQWSLFNKWNDRASHFLLAADLSDQNGSLGNGILLSNIKNEDLYGQPMRTLAGNPVYSVPYSATLIGINRRPVWSVYDVYEELDKHGWSDGIEDKIILAFEELDQYLATHYLFNERYPPSFVHSTDGFSEGFTESFTYGSEDLKCGSVSLIKGLANAIFGTAIDIEDHDYCVWRTKQQYAFARQTNVDAYQWGGTAAMFVPIGPRIGRMARLGRIGTGVADALDNALMEVGTAAPGTPFHQRFEKAMLPAGIGFVTGTTFFSPAKIPKRK